MSKESSDLSTAVRGSNFNPATPDPKGKRKNASGSPRKARDDQASEVRLANYASAPSLAWPAAMHPATAVLLPRADSLCLMHPFACSQDADD